jgi:hypothetical protein
MLRTSTMSLIAITVLLQLPSAGLRADGPRVTELVHEVAELPIGHAREQQLRELLVICVHRQVSMRRTR